MDESHQTDICRVCRSEGTSDRPLYHPCICTGSIKYIHQDCLVQWLKYSKKEFCELCKHKFTFKPIYSPDMPKRLPLRDIAGGLCNSVLKAVRYWLHYTLVAIAWLGVVPLTAFRIYKCLFSGSLTSILMLPIDLLSPENVASDIFQGCFVVTCTLCAFISLIWLREQILHGGGPEWLEREIPAPAARGAVVVPPANNAAPLGGEDAEQAAAAVPDDEQGHPVDQPIDNQIDADAPANNAVQDDIWNPIDWDRADDLTWERLLGLDGSLVFLEHVFWVVSLNTLFIIVFAFLPYHIGACATTVFHLQAMVEALHSQMLATALLGYLIIAAMMMLAFTVMSILKLKRARRVIGLCYIVVKVSLLVVIEIGLFPLMSGWWLDICSLGMFDASWKDRMKSFGVAPGTSMFIHWLVGMVYIFYFASFILLLREVLRPGVLWFLRNLNDPDFNPIQEMIQLPVYRHIRRLIASMVIFGSTVLLMLWLPVYVIKRVFVGFLPYHVALSADAPISELSLELLLLQVILPALLEQGNTRQWFKSVIRGWCVGVAWLLDLRSYLLGDQPQPADAAAAPQGDGEAGEDAGEEEEEEDEADDLEDGEDAAVGEPPAVALADGVHNQQQEAAAVPPAAQGLAAAHQAMLFGRGPMGFQPYVQPSWFTLRLACLFALMCVTLFCGSLLSCIVPVYVGRQVMSVWVNGGRVHELYTAGCGLYACWLSLRLLILLSHWLPQGWHFIVTKMQSWTVLMVKCAVIAAVLLGLVPLMLGLLFELIVVIPLRVPLDQTPLFFLWQDWALGVLHAKIICAVTLMGPQFWLKQAIEQVYNQGLWNIDLTFVLLRLCMPVVGVLGMCLAVPYVVARGLIPACGLSFELENLVWRRCYPFIVFMLLLVSFSVLQVRQFNRLYEHIRNDKYLVGQKLVNFERRAAESSSSAAS